MPKYFSLALNRFSKVWNLCNRRTVATCRLLGANSMYGNEAAVANRIATGFPWNSLAAHNANYFLILHRVAKTRKSHTIHKSTDRRSLATFMNFNSKRRVASLSRGRSNYDWLGCAPKWLQSAVDTTQASVDFIHFCGNWKWRRPFSADAFFKFLQFFCFRRMRLKSFGFASPFWRSSCVTHCSLKPKFQLTDPEECSKALADLILCRDLSSTRFSKQWYTPNLCD